MRRVAVFALAYSVLQYAATKTFIFSNSSCTNADSGKNLIIIQSPLLLFFVTGKGTWIELLLRLAVRKSISATLYLQRMLQISQRTCLQKSAIIEMKGSY